MNAFALSHCIDSRSQHFLESIEKAKKAALIPKKTYEVYKVLLPVLVKCAETRKKITHRFEICQQTSCDDAFNCATDMSSFSKSVRDIFAVLYGVVSDEKRFFPLRYFVKKQLDSWDDFVVDCEISADKEIHTLVENIADAI